MICENLKLTPSAEHIESDAVTVLRANASEFVSLGHVIPMCSLFSSDLTALKRLSHALFVDWYVPTMSICCSSSISVCRKKDKPSTYQHENSAQISRFPAKCDAWLGTRANILSIRKDSCNFAAVFTFWETPEVLQKRLYGDRGPNPYHFIHIYRKGISFVCDLLLTNAVPLSLC